MADPFDAFGNSSSDGEEGELDPTMALVSLGLTQALLKVSAVPLPLRKILVVLGFDDTDAKAWKEALRAKQMKQLTFCTEDQLIGIKNDDNVTFDAIIWSRESTLTIKSRDSLYDLVDAVLIPGGCCLWQTNAVTANRNDDRWFTKSSLRVDTPWIVCETWPVQIQDETCPWLKQPRDLGQERRRLSDATIRLTVQERCSGKVHPSNIAKAVRTMREYGYCVLPGLLHRQFELCVEYGQAVLSDVRQAATILEKEGIDLYKPSRGSKDPESYRELSMREDCRMDLRHGPALHTVRGINNEAISIGAHENSRENDFLRGNSTILAIVRRVMNPVQSKELSAGNFGRHNFDGGGPDGSFQTLHAGIVGGIVSLPGSADQAIHTDTPHIFEHITNLPAHYINVFTPGCPAAHNVGQTALVHGSHQLDFVAKYVADEQRRGHEQFDASLWDFLVRPVLNVTDVLLFDCRILHFGLANRHDTIERPLLYTNLTMHWFHDPKNWDLHKSIFHEQNSTG